MNEKKFSLKDYERLESFASAVQYVQRSMSMLNHHIEVLKRIGDVDALDDFNKLLCEFIDEIVTKYKHTLSNE